MLFTDLLTLKLNCYGFCNALCLCFHSQISRIACLFCSHFGTWPVAMLAQSKNKAIVEGPVCNASQVIGWHTNEKSKRLRRFHVDMSGFAFNSTILWDPKRWNRPFSNPIRQLDTVKEGFQVCIMPIAFSGCSWYCLKYVIYYIWYSIPSIPWFFSFFTGDHIHWASGRRWKSNGKCTTQLFKDTELASSFRCSWSCLSQRLAAPEEPRSCSAHQVIELQGAILMVKIKRGMLSNFSRAVLLCLLDYRHSFQPLLLWSKQQEQNKV